MVIYNVTVSIDNEVANDWLSWMKEVHIPEVLATGLFVDYKFLKLLEDKEVDDGSTTYAVQYMAHGVKEVADYLENHATTLRAKQNERYEGRLAAFRTVLEEV